MSPLNARWCVFTGKLISMSRMAAHDAIEALGGFCVDRITGSMDRTNAVLIAGDRPGLKLAKAKALGVPIIDEWAFLRCLPAIEGELTPLRLISISAHYHTPAFILS